MILTGIDEKPYYWNLLLAFLASIDKNSPETPVTVHVINNKKHELLKKFKCEKFKCVVDVQYTYFGGSDSRKNYFRHIWLASHLLLHQSSVAWLDPDILVRGNLSPLFTNLSPESIRYRHKRKCKPEHQFQGGVYILGSSDKSVDYCDQIYNKLTNTDDWMLPQLLCLKQIKESGLEVSPLTKKYNDSKFKSDSIIWHCKHSHFKDPKFQKEYKKYLKIGKEVIK